MDTSSFFGPNSSFALRSHKQAHMAGFLHQLGGSSSGTYSFVSRPTSILLPRPPLPSFPQAPRFSGQSLNGSNGSTTSLASNNISFGRQVIKSSENGRYSNGRSYKPLGTNGKHWQNGSLPSMGSLQRGRPGGLAPVSPQPTDSIFLKRRENGKGEKTEAQNNEGVKKRSRTSYGRLRVVRDAKTRVQRAKEKIQSPKKVQKDKWANVGVQTELPKSRFADVQTQTENEKEEVEFTKEELERLIDKLQGNVKRPNGDRTWKVMDNRLKIRDNGIEEEMRGAEREQVPKDEEVEAKDHKNMNVEFLERETGKQDQTVTDKRGEVDSFTEESLPEEIDEAVVKNVEELKAIKDGGDEISKMPNTLDEETCNEQHQTVNIEDKKLEESLLNSDADEKDGKGDEDTSANEDGAKKDKDESKDEDEDEEELLPLLRAIIGRTMQQSLVEVIEEEEDLRKRD